MGLSDVYIPELDNPEYDSIQPVLDKEDKLEYEYVVIQEESPMLQPIYQELNSIRFILVFLLGCLTIKYVYRLLRIFF